MRFSYTKYFKWPESTWPSSGRWSRHDAVHQPRSRTSTNRNRLQNFLLLPGGIRSHLTWKTNCQGLIMAQGLGPIGRGQTPGKWLAGIRVISCHDVQTGDTPDHVVVEGPNLISWQQWVYFQHRVNTWISGSATSTIKKTFGNLHAQVFVFDKPVNSNFALC